MTQVLIISALLYLGFVFALAWYFERGGAQAWAKKYQGQIYALSLAVYCSAWTFYGSIGRAASGRLDFLLIYLGPSLVMLFWYPLLRRLLALKQRHGLNSLADLFSDRYGKSAALGRWVALLSVLAILPYLSLQIKAISESFSFLAQGQSAPQRSAFWADPALYVTLIMWGFTVLFGARYLQGSQSKPGLVGLIAVESLVKLGAFLLVGLVVLTSAWPQADFKAAAQAPPLVEGSEWMAILLVSALAFMLLPRQFQMGVIEARPGASNRRAIWAFPLYLFLINLLVLPLAWLGTAVLPGLSSDFYLLGLSQNYGGTPLSVVAFIGGLSAASSMIIVSTLALGNMLSTHLLVPLLRWGSARDLSGSILMLRRLAIFLILALAYAYYHFSVAERSLLNIGLVSFVGISQFAPAFLAALFLPAVRRPAVYAGLAAGFALWFYFLVLPGFGLGLDGSALWHPQALAQALGFSQIAAATFLSLAFNAALLLGLSPKSQASAAELQSALLYREVLRLEHSDEPEPGYRASAPFPDIKSLLNRFLGSYRTAEVLERYARRHQIDWSSAPQADTRMINYAQRLLAEAIGPASAHLVIDSVVERKELSVGAVLRILEENQAVRSLNKELSQRRDQLKKAKDQLEEANAKLREFSELKDEFLYTVTHELRTPLTAIRAQAEILYDDREMPEADQLRFLDNIVSDCDRLTRLIGNVLDLEKYESGSQKLSLERLDLVALLSQVQDRFQAMAAQKSVDFQLQLSQERLITFADRDRLAQVLHNLVSNAFKHCRAQGGQVAISLHSQGGQVLIAVSDNGAGIPAGDRELVFDKFYQVRNQTRRKPTGHGLGLAICKNIVQMHRGQIWVEALNAEGGTRLCFSLPLYRPENTLAQSLKTPL